MRAADGVVLLWAVPVVAAVVAVVLVLRRARELEDAAVDLTVAVHRTGELRRPLAAIRSEMDRSAPLVDRVWAHWSNAADGTEQGV